MVEMVFEDENIRCMWRQGSSGYLLITFGDLSVFANGLSFYAEAPADKLDLTVFAIMAKGPNWYPISSITAARAAVADRISRYGEIVINGSSMGGYGAIKHSRVFGATTVLAYCPQSTLDPGECVGFNPGWQRYFRPEVMTGMGVKQADISGQLYVFSDPRHFLDRSHLRKVLAVCPEARAIPVISGGHDIAPILAGTSNFLALVDGCRQGDLRRIWETVRKARKDNFYRKRVLIADAIARKPILLALVLANCENDEHVVRILSDQLVNMVQAISKTKSSVCLNDFLEKFSSRLDLRRKLIVAFMLGKQRNISARAKTHFNTVICYDAIRDTILHADVNCIENEDLIPLNLEWKNEQVSFVARSLMCGFYLTPDVSETVLLGQKEEYFEILPRADGRYFFQKEGCYLSAQPDGMLSCDRYEANDWEAFSIDLHIT